MRTISKHANRRLYDASERRAVTLLEISELVVRGESISVIDKPSGEDITVVTLLQSLLERLKRRPSEGLEAGEVDRLVAELRKAMSAGMHDSDQYDGEMERGPAASAGTVGGAV